MQVIVEETNYTVTVETASQVLVVKEQTTHQVNIAMTGPPGRSVEIFDAPVGKMVVKRLYVDGGKVIVEYDDIPV